jgi:phage tail sheath protein FI
MFIADGPRPMVLQGQKKIVRPTKPENTIDANILPFVKYATGLNTNYGAGYLDWFQVTDEFSGDEFWCPPSIKAMGVYINTDLNFNFWDAPAGLNRGVIQALDTAFSPTIKQAGSIYGKNWNYAINYPYDGIVLEGQKTFQVKPSAFDRVNVRRLFLRLERQVFKIARYFVYEGCTSYTRQRLVDAIEPLLYQVKVGGGLYDYKIKCDDSNNTPQSIDQNELRCVIGLKPTKTAEFVMIDFVALSTGGSWSEAGF